MAPGFDQVPELDPWITYLDTDGRRYLNRPIDAYSFHQYGPLNTVKNMITQRDGYRRCTRAGECVEDFWLTEFGFSTSKPCWWPGWAEPPADPGAAIVEVMRHCLNDTPHCRKAFLWALAYDDPADSCPRVGDFGLLDPLSWLPRPKYNNVVGYVPSVVCGGMPDGTFCGDGDAGIFATCEAGVCR
jgi:hypothetical protein